jgi:hypothetical protein
VDPADLARTEKVTASSTRTYTAFREFLQKTDRGASVEHARAPFSFRAGSPEKLGTINSV